MSALMPTSNTNDMNPYVKDSLIKFHNVESDLYSSNKKFGIFSIEMAQTTMTQKDQELNSTNDMSGSMSDICQDGRSKMQHLQVTLENITRLLSANAEQIAVNLEITGFDDSIVQVLEPTKITNDSEQLQQIINKVKKELYSRGSTNIHLALQDATSRLEQKPIASQKSLIFMTDGNITNGPTDIETLIHSVPKDSHNYFIGFGADHDFALLQQLSSINLGSYYYVDKIENAGLVFGEIIHSILYTALRNVTIQVTNGEIYDFQTNQWLTEIRVPNLCGEAKKNYHVRSEIPYEFELTLTGLSETGTISMSELALPELEDIEKGIKEVVDLSKYIYRQYVLELLHISAKIASSSSSSTSRSEDRERKTNHIEEMKNMRKKIEAYSALQDSQEDKDFLKQLQDDLYISEKTLLSENALLYTVARQTSQGRECSYNVTDLKRQNAFAHEYDEDYEIEDAPISRAYTSDTQQKIMRGVSAGAEISCTENEASWDYLDDECSKENNTKNISQIQRQCGGIKRQYAIN